MRLAREVLALGQGGLELKTGRFAPIHLANVLLVLTQGGQSSEREALTMCVNWTAKWCHSLKPYRIGRVESAPKAGKT